MAIAIIPARGGSKRIPHKNIRPFHGRPMIAWSISAALDCGLFSQVVVSTDDATIAQIARDEGAQTPFVRNADLADDYAGTTEVIVDAINRLKLSPNSDVCCLYPTAPMVQAEDLRSGHTGLLRSPDAYIFSVCEFPAPIARGYHCDGDHIRPIEYENMAKRSQDLPTAYFDAGQFYWAKAATWISGKKVWDNAKPVILPASRVCDIDTEDDWARAEHMFAWLQKP